MRVDHQRPNVKDVREIAQLTDAIYRAGGDLTSARRNGWRRSCSITTAATIRSTKTDRSTSEVLEKLTDYHGARARSGLSAAGEAYKHLHRRSAYADRRADSRIHTTFNQA